MGISWVWCGVLLYLALFLTPFPLVTADQMASSHVPSVILPGPPLVTADQMASLTHVPLEIAQLPGGYLTVKSSTSWHNTLSAPDSVKFDDGSVARIILSSVSYDLMDRYVGCVCGFVYNQTYNSSIFAIFGVYFDDRNISKISELVWSAKPNNPVSVNATLQLTSERGFLLQDADGTIAWSTNITNKSVAAINLTDTCNLMLLDENNATIWQSFDHPTDTLVLGQKLVAGQNLTSEGGLYSLSLTRKGLFFYINSNPPQCYFSYTPYTELSYAQFLNGSLTIYSGESFRTYFDGQLKSVAAQYMRLEPDGHLRFYNKSWDEVDDFLSERVGYCDYPMACGNYSICSEKSCSCPRPKNGTSYFQPIDYRQPTLGCSLITPLSCEDSKNHFLLEMESITYFIFNQDKRGINPDHRHINLESCKQACLKNCSCKGAIYETSNQVGNCYLQSEIFSLEDIHEADMNLSIGCEVYIKVQNVPSEAPHYGKKKHPLGVILGSSLGSLFLLSLLIGIFVFLFWKKENADEAEEYDLDHLPGMPTRYSYHDLQASTENFNKELGRGGFGTVFEGALIDGTKVAVKRLDGLSQIKKSFLAEVETIGSIHHFNLVRLIGFCAEKSHRLLVYEYMSNGSLDRWVFQKNPEMLLDWHHRKKIILDIARGLTYLHEGCRQKIVHLDIKPQNILLDENFNAKVSDFGLSKLVDRDQSQVVTAMRGTPGYMAPEWSTSVITEKVDVYSFGIVLLEILCGRRNFDRSQPEEAMHLLELYKKKIEEDQLLDLIDKNNEDMQSNGVEVVNMMRVAAWCLHNDYTKRPSMSMVDKFLEGVVNIESNLDYFFSNPALPNTILGVDNHEVHVTTTTPLIASILSGPR